jgi:hypothetical protein
MKTSGARNIKKSYQKTKPRNPRKKIIQNKAVHPTGCTPRDILFAN